MNVLTGLAIGDALGMPFEGCSLEHILKSSWTGEMLSNSYLKLQPGQYTDDTKMARALAESLIENKSFSMEKAAEKYVGWYQSRDIRGIGVTCARAINNLINGVPVSEANQSRGKARPSFKRISAGETNDCCGNGTVMRCAPVGVFYRDNNELLKTSAEQDALITHSHVDAQDGSWAVCSGIQSLLQDKSKEKFLEKLLGLSYSGKNIKEKLLQAQALLVEEPPSFVSARDKLGSAGTAHETLATAVFCFMKFNTPREILIGSVLIGGDADTRAAVAGAFCGAYYKLEEFPQEWLDALEDKSELMKIDSQLFDL